MSKFPNTEPISTNHNRVFRSVMPKPVQRPDGLSICLSEGAGYFELLTVVMYERLFGRLALS